MRFDFQAQFNQVFNRFAAAAVAKKAGEASTESLSIQKQRLENEQTVSQAKAKESEANAFNARAQGRLANYELKMQKKKAAEDSAIQAISSRMEEAAASKTAYGNMVANLYYKPGEQTIDLMKGEQTK